MPSPSPKKKMVQELITEAKNTIKESRSEIGQLEHKQKSMTAEYAQGLPNSQEATPTSVTTLSTEPLNSNLGFVTPQRQKGTPPTPSNNAAGFTATANTSGSPPSPTGRALAEAFSNGFLMEGTDSRVLEFLTAASKPMQTLEASKTDPTHQMDWDELATLCATQDPSVQQCIFKAAKSMHSADLEVLELQDKQASLALPDAIASSAKISVSLKASVKLKEHETTKQLSNELALLVSTFQTQATELFLT